MTEIFFITQRALHVGLIPAVNGFTTMASNLSKEIQDRDADERLKRLSMVRVGGREFVVGRMVACAMECDPCDQQIQKYWGGGEEKGVSEGLK